MFITEAFLVYNSRLMKLFPDLHQLQPGSLVGYNLSKGPSLGIITQALQGSVRVFIKNQKEFRIKSSSIFVESDRVDMDLNPKQWVQILQNSEEMVQGRQANVDLAFLHELLLEDDARDYSFEELLQLLYSNEDFDLPQVLGFARALCEDACFFGKRKGTFFPNSTESVEEFHRQQELSILRQKRDESCLNFLQTGDLTHLSSADTDSSEIRDELRDLGIHWDKSSQYMKRRDLLRQAGILDRYQLRELLVKVNLFDRDYPFELEEVGYPRQFSDHFCKYISYDAPEPKAPSTERDLRTLYTITVDGPDTLDRDDAISFDGDYFYVHISNVAALVGHDSRVVKEIRKRLSSLYLPDGTLGMFPDHLSLQKLSLDQGQERAAMTIKFRFVDREGHRHPEFEVFASRIKVDENLTYEQMDIRYDDFAEYFQLVPQLRQARLDRGAISFNQSEFKIQVKEGHINLLRKRTYESQDVIAELSILSNSLFAKFAWENQIPILFRCQDGDRKKVQASPFYSARIENFYQYYKLKRNWGRTRWSTENTAHFSLGLKYYSQLTSPIRRYVDFINQRQILNYFEDEPYLSSEDLEHECLQIGSGLFEVQGLQMRRQKHFVLRYLDQRSQSYIDQPMYLRAIVLDKGEDWVFFQLPDFEQVFRFKQSTRDLKEGSLCRMRLDRICCIRHEVFGRLESLTPNDQTEFFDLDS